MSTKDTDPQWRPPASKPGEVTTEPGADASRAAAEDLLASLAKVPLPEEGVAETKGHDAASFAAGPHTPPRGRDDTLEDEPAVVLNTTQPFGLPVTPGSVPLGTPPPAPAVEEAETLPRRVPKKPLGDTVPSARVRRHNKSLLLIAAVLGAAGVILVASFLKSMAPAESPAPIAPTPTRVEPATAAPPSPSPSPTPIEVAPPPAPELPSSSSNVAPPHKSDPPRKNPPAAPSTTTSALVPPPPPASSSDFPWRQ